jgi:hypothetical protein
MALKPEDSRMYVYQNKWEVFKCGAGKGWKRSVGPIVGKMK